MDYLYQACHNLLDKSEYEFYTSLDDEQLFNFLERFHKQPCLSPGNCQLCKAVKERLILLDPGAYDGYLEPEYVDEEEV